MKTVSWFEDTVQHCEGGDLTQYIIKHIEARELIPEDEIWRFTAQLVDALKYCHDPDVRGDELHPLPIIHRDLKPGNSMSTSFSLSSSITSSDLLSF
jgi:serine/threonine protein kinase